jgi:hypothetical protein
MSAASSGVEHDGRHPVVPALGEPPGALPSMPRRPQLGVAGPSGVLLGADIGDRVPSWTDRGASKSTLLFIEEVVGAPLSTSMDTR